MKRPFAFFAILLALPLLAWAASPGDVRINEVMYDDTASTDIEWVELYNTTGSPINISGWWLGDCDAYPGPSTEGYLVVPATTTLDSYLVICKQDLPGITGEIICTQTGSWILGNSGDNLALYDAASGGTLIDGSLTVQYPDDAPTNVGASIEKINQNGAWSGLTADWDASTYAFATSGRFRFCTPGFRNSVATGDITRPTIVSATALSATQVDVVFSEAVDQTTAETESNYSIDGGIGNPSLAVRDAVSHDRVHLTVSTLTAYTTYTLTVNNVQDLAGNPILPNSTVQFVYRAEIGNVIITEFMANPAAVVDQSGEWFEVRNMTGAQINMNGWIIKDNAGRDTLEGNVYINPGQYFVFCVNDTLATNGGVPTNYDYVYGTSGWGLALSNSGDDRIVIYDNIGRLQDSVAYNYVSWGCQAGASHQLKNLNYDNNIDTSWCISLNAWPGSAGDRGTPGSACDCGAPPEPIPLTICQARQQTVCGVPLYLDSLIQVRGIVSFADTCMRAAFLQIGGCGIELYGSAVDDTLLPPNRQMRPGDSVRVTGYLRQYAGLAEIAFAFGYTPQVVLLDSNKALPRIHLDCSLISYAADRGPDSCSGEDYESEMVNVASVDFIASGTFSPGDMNYLATCANGDTIEVRIDSCSAFLNTTIPEGPVDVFGILSQYDWSLCYCHHYQIIPTELVSARCVNPDSVTIMRMAANPDSVRLEWRPNVGQPCQCYRIYRSTDPFAAFPVSWIQVACVCNQTYYEYAPPISSTDKIFYRVTAVSSCP
ncbi:MAG: lamin tail domain-containing protein [bacterium]